MENLFKNFALGVALLLVFCGLIALGATVDGDAFNWVHLGLAGGCSMVGLLAVVACDRVEQKR